MTDKSVLLQVVNLRKVYMSGPNELEVLSGVDFSVAPGEIIALMGPSGVGKTTLLNLIGALDVPTSGNIFLQDKNLADMSRNELARVRNRSLGFVFQFHHLLPEFTAEENVLIPGIIQQSPTKIQQEYARDLLGKFGLSGRLHHYPHELSGGEKQRVALGRALMNKPALVLADEPTGNLDRKTGARLLEALISFAHEENQTFLIATHDEEISQRADRILLLENGAVRETTITS
ncbi:MAG: ABC transporter ATP-binding protein [Candidatus Marinimicrobia bacterium]|nr:ABC transporter ATP-binding protein [Candidatus Neomarinimicrobiota bacterium]MCF7828971.1 ABC transporter ATP-binding protein [Candidatus Neomarinimicrobiota bacterium]MCF7879931.1 ABC transporter ATP-binding protein [Candidatus Neomarinimicrobiota bacterium]